MTLLLLSTCIVPLAIISRETLRIEIRQLPSHHHEALTHKNEVFTKDGTQGGETLLALRLLVLTEICDIFHMRLNSTLFQPNSCILGTNGRTFGSTFESIDPENLVLDRSKVRVI